MRAPFSITRDHVSRVFCIPQGEFGPKPAFTPFPLNPSSFVTRKVSQKPRGSSVTYSLST